MNLTSLLTAEFAWTMCLVRLDKMHDKCILRLPQISFIPWSIRCSLGRVQSSHLLGHFTSNCCGCLDTRLMMQPGLEIILMSLLIRKNSKIANFHCPFNTKYTQKISIHSDSAVGQKYLSRLIIKILFPNSQKPRKHIYNKIYTDFPASAQYLWHHSPGSPPSCLTPRWGVGVGQDKCNSGGFMRRPGSGDGSGGS